MQVRLAFSIAIRAQGDILLLDEVLAVGDAAFQQKCYNYFEDLREQKKSVVFVSHDMDAVRRFCTNAVYIKEGKLIMAGTPSEIADIYREENVEAAHDDVEGKEESLKDVYSLTTKVANYEHNKLKLSFSYSTEMYAGISVIKDGIPIAEINSLPAITFSGSRKFTFTLDTGILNGGAYYITTAVFRVRNQELMSLGKNQCQFVVKGYEPTKGGALRLENTWQYEQE
jgi:ABC-type proline/glycine betaine transport system ATPase subunit